MKNTDPIITTGNWTKETICETMNDAVNVEHLTDELAKWWAEEEAQYASDAITLGEDYYCTKITQLNEELIKKIY